VALVIVRVRVLDPVAQREYEVVENLVKVQSCTFGGDHAEAQAAGGVAGLPSECGGLHLELGAGPYREQYGGYRQRRYLWLSTILDIEEVQP
jgi:hypothetical protein